MVRFLLIQPYGDLNSLAVRSIAVLTIFCTIKLKSGKHTETNVEILCYIVVNSKTFYEIIAITMFLFQLL